MKHRKILTSLFIFVFTAMTVVFFQNCGDVNIHPGETVAMASSSTEFCLAPPESETKYIKILFVVDKSGSNFQTRDTSGAVVPGNDPDLAAGRRTRSIQAFFDLYKDNPYYKWGFIGFGVSGASLIQAWVNSGSMADPTFGTATELQSAIDKHKSTPDDGCTPYLGALQMAAGAIKKDLDDHPDEDSTYHVFFMSDGRPDDPSATTAQCGGGVVNPDPTNSSDPFLRAIDTIRLPDSARIKFHTTYYANNLDPNARDGLASMATRGGGQFVSSIGDATGIFDFSGIVAGQHSEAWRVKRNQLHVYNLNSAFCDDGTIGSDSDSDGLCDKDELAYNTMYVAVLNKKYPGKFFSSTNRNSLDPYYSDAFVWKMNLLPTGPGLAECKDTTADKDHDFLNTCEENALRDRNANGPTNDWTIVGDHADPTNPDSDGDSYLDFHEFYTFRMETGYSSAVNYTNLGDYYAPGVSGEDILHEHRNIKKPLIRNYDSTFTFSHVDETTGQICYIFHQENLPLHKTQAMSDKTKLSNLDDLVHDEDVNNLMFYFIATPETDPNGRGYLFYAHKPVRFSRADDLSRALNIQYKEFRQYKVPDVAPGL